MTTVRVKGPGWETVTEVRRAFGAARAVAQRLRAKGLTVEVVDGEVHVDATAGVRRKA